MNVLHLCLTYPEQPDEPAESSLRGHTPLWRAGQFRYTHTRTQPR